MSDAVFLDTGIFIAFMVPKDRFHEQARAMFARPPRRLHTSLAVVSESYSWFLHRAGEEPARWFLALLRELPKLELHEVNLALHKKAQRILDELRGTKLTYVDASSLALMDATKIRVVWGTDHHLALRGARVDPR